MSRRSEYREYCQRRDEEHRQSAALAAEQSKKEGLPELQGSEKQIIWAEQIRRTKKDEMMTNLASMKKEKNPVFEYAKNRIKKTLAEKVWASFWIDNRGTDYNVDFYVEKQKAEIEAKKLEAEKNEIEKEVLAEMPKPEPVEPEEKLKKMPAGFDTAIPEPNFSNIQ